MVKKRNATRIEFKREICQTHARMAVWYGTFQFLSRSTVRLFCKGTCTVRWYGTPFCKGTGAVRCMLFELETQDFSHIAPGSCIQRQKTAETDAKCINL